MISRLGTVVSFGLLITVIVFGRDFASYLITSADVVSDSVREQIPVAFELDRARHMIDALAPQIKKDRYAIAREQVELENLQSRIDELVESQTLEKRSLERLQKRLESQSKSRRRGQWSLSNRADCTDRRNQILDLQNAGSHAGKPQTHLRRPSRGSRVKTVEPRVVGCRQASIVCRGRMPGGSTAVDASRRPAE